MDYKEIEKEKAYTRCTKKHYTTQHQNCSKCTISRCLCNIQCPHRGPYSANQSINFSVEYDHPTLTCTGNVMTRDGRKQLDYYFATKLIIRDLSTENYIVLLRRESIRELLMLPYSNKGKENCNHFDNETLVKNNNFWTDLLEQRQRLSFHSIAFNYGRWETGQSRDKYAQACHAHVHLYFDNETWEG